MHKTLILLVFLTTSTISCQSTGTLRGEAARQPVPLTDGKPIWDVAGGFMTDLQSLVDDAEEADHIILGELHDNPRHHEGQAEILHTLLERDRRPAVAFEMFRVDQQELIDDHFDQHPEDVTGLADALRWGDTGWPDWAYYAPLVSAANEAGVPVIAANLSAATLARMRDEGMDAVEPGWRQRTGVDVPLPPGSGEELAELIAVAHCGYAPDSLVDVMIDMQRARDAKLAERMLVGNAAADGEGAVLIAGNQHARQDRGVPFYLRHMDPDAHVVSIAFIETDAEDGMVVDPALLAADMPYDYLWFTPGIERDDPCERFRRHMERKTPPPPGKMGSE